MSILHSVLHFGITVRIFVLWCEYATVSTVVQIWYGNMFIDAVSSLFTIVSTATSYLTSLEGFDFEDFPQITSPTNLLTSLHASSVCASKLTISEDERSHFAVSAMSKPKWETLHKYLKSYQTMVLRRKIGREYLICTLGAAFQSIRRKSWRSYPYYATSGHKERWN